MRIGFLVAAMLLPALVLGGDAEDAAIRRVLQKQAEAWNRGDIAAFVGSYADNCTFVGEKISEGRSAVEERYRRTYYSRAAMGHLDFSDLKIKKIDGRVATVTGKFSLHRSTQGGGDKSGIFSLVLQRQAGLWRIVLDHTS